MLHRLLLSTQYWWHESSGKQPVEIEAHHACLSFLPVVGESVTNSVAVCQHLPLQLRNYPCLDLKNYPSWKGLLQVCLLNCLLAQKSCHSSRFAAFSSSCHYHLLLNIPIEMSLLLLASFTSVQYVYTSEGGIMLKQFLKALFSQVPKCLDSGHTPCPAHHDQLVAAIAPGINLELKLV